MFESQHVRDDIVQGFKLLIAKKVSTLEKTSGSTSGSPRNNGKIIDEDVSEKNSAFGLSRIPPISPSPTSTL